MSTSASVERGLGLGLGLNIVTKPVLEPVSLEQAKAWLRVTQVDDDASINAVRRAARAIVERDTRLALITQTWDQAIDRFPCGTGHLEIALVPLLTVTSITWYDTDAVATTLATSVYDVDTSRTPGRICLKPSQTWPSGTRSYVAGVIRVTCGFGTATTSVPDDLLQAMRVQMNALYLNRTLDEGEQRHYRYLIDPWVVHSVGD